MATKMHLLSADKVRLQGQGQVTSIKSGQMEERREQTGRKGPQGIARPGPGTPPLLGLCGLLVESSLQRY